MIMCGICGFTWENKELIETMTEIITHRGPDAGGTFVGKGVSLGNRRLSIIDLRDEGNQPIFNEDKSICIVYNGEIYNFPELKKELLSKGHRFYSNTDTEVIVHAYEEFGEDCLHKFNGMFAFAIYDMPKRKLFLARDRIGIKPLYYYWDHEKLIFGSEIKSILQCGEIEKNVDLQSLYYYLGYEFVPGPATMFQNIYKLNPGHYLLYKEGKLEVNRYWDLKFHRNRETSQYYYVEKLRDLIDSSVKLRLISDVPVGVFLSGGLDSSTVVAFMKKHFGGRLHTFSIDYDDKSYSEIEYAKFVAKYYDTDHHILNIKDITPQDVEKSIWHLDEPMTDLSAIPFYMISHKARQTVKVCLSGEGGDEVFAGYDRFKASKFYYNYYTKLLPNFVRNKIIIPLVDALPDTKKKKGLINITKRFIDGAKLPDDGFHMKWQYFSNETLEKSLYSPSIKQKITLNGLHLIKECAERCDCDDRLSRELYIDTRFTMPDSVLMKVDKMSMASSLEVRVPFLDHRILEFSASIPSELKLKGFQTKYIFRETIKDILPDKIVHRGKQGYSFPSKNWLRYQMKDFMMEEINSCALLKEVLNMDYVNVLINEHLSWKKNHNHVLWALLNVALWHKKFF